ncbi:MAG: carbamoyltransferase HypF [Anaerolineales bacterium]|nr:carbamoyltransferase HypF [Anaerolineales bacterium]MCX7755620.1 carbamoyltransferase HypF [Anaerolineales bacterium]MDW8276597.1 carbamoyltransferase HypF [Anaerolineales bacterium]
MTPQGLSIHITGIVQGVGFRPFVYNLARRHQLTGWVRNTSAGVDIEVDGETTRLQAFLAHLRTELPPLARIDSFHVAERPAAGFEQFEILHSESQVGAFQPISPDVAVCPDCLREMNDPADRRYRYPFINCTNCGPRFTIIQDIPYDRPKTTMAAFEMCAECRAEYEDPANRRFHAQPVACPRCGPKIWLEEFPLRANGKRTVLINVGEDGLQRARRLLAEGKILAIKGLGGFHLACDATNPAAVAELRRRKLRVDKPFAVMMADLPTVRRHCRVSEAERALLQSPERPIVLLERHAASKIVREVAPGQRTLGVMLPYTPLHHLLLERAKDFPEVLVMTSGNLSEEPICIENIEARTRLAGLADAFLMHDREIHIRADDSVVRVIGHQSPLATGSSASDRNRTPIPDYLSLNTYPLRRSRGYAPSPLHLPWNMPSVLATGAELKNTFCITNERYAFLSHHIGDLENYETLQSFEQGIQHFERLFRVSPQAIAYDLHPDYLATRYALERLERENLHGVGVQHHHAHIAALMAERGLDGSHPVIGVSFDGTGYGPDGTIWGGEFLIADYARFERAAHLHTFPLPGGDAAVRRPSRTALGLLYALGLEWDDALPTHRDLCYEDRTAIRIQLERRLNVPLTSSMGRLFDAAAALAGVRQQVNYEAQAAIEFEALADPDETGCYEFAYQEALINPRPALEQLIADVLAGVPVPVISARFHNGVAEMVKTVCLRLSDRYDLSEVALSGGVWQNMCLLRKTLALLEKQGFTVYVHSRVPTNDGGLALGQAAIAGYQLKES